MIESLLSERGGMLSTDLKQTLIDELGLGEDAARKKVSREASSNKNICKLNGLSFSKRAVFYYHKNEFGSSRYWQSLYEALEKSNSVYAYAIAALIARDEIIPAEHFSIHCGAPNRMAKNLSSDRVLADLIKINAIKETHIPHIGDCVCLVQDEQFSNQKGESVKARLLAEDILLKSLSTWLKNLNLISYEAFTFGRESKTNPVNGFYWDISGPSYLSSLIRLEGDNKKPGFLVCDVLLDCTVTATSIAPFLNKVKKSQFSKRQGRCLYIFVAEKFSEDAFSIAKRTGIIPATVTNLFGKEVAEALKSVISIFSHLAGLLHSPDDIGKLFTKLNKIEGAVGNLRGTLFEFIVAESLRENFPNVFMGRKIKSLDGIKKYDADITIEKPKETVIIECKSGYAGSTLSEDDLQRWLNEQVPEMYRSLSSSREGRERSYSFELWSTKKLTENSLALLETYKTQASKYNISYKLAEGIRQEIKKANKPSLEKLLEQHFLTKINPEKDDTLKVT